MRFIVCALMALALTSCAKTPSSGDDGNGQQADTPPILDLLKSGDISACAHPDVKSLFKENSTISFEDAHKRLHLTQDQYDTVELEVATLDEINTTGVNSAISEVRCQAKLTVGELKLAPVDYSIRPMSSGDGAIISFDKATQQAFGLAKLDNERSLLAAVPKSSEGAVSSTQSSETPADSAGAAPPAAENPTSPYDKAKAALSQADPAAGNH